MSKNKADYAKKIKLGISNTKNAQEFWAIVQSLKNKQVYENHIDIRLWGQFHRELLANYTISSITFLYCIHPHFDVDFTLPELQSSINKSKLNRAPGLDSISNELYKFLTPEWKLCLLNVFNTVLNTEEIPQSRIKVYTILIYKKGNTLDPLNYRGIAALNAMTKLFTQTLSIRIQEWCEINNTLNECQAGFRKKRLSRDNISALSSIINLPLRLAKHHSFVIFVDFRRAFDSVNYNIQRSKLREMRISSKIIRIKGNYKIFIPIIQGVLQGQTLSPMKFLIFLNDIWSYFKQRGASGLNIDRHNSLLSQHMQTTSRFYATPKQRCAEIIIF